MADTMNINGEDGLNNISGAGNSLFSIDKVQLMFSLTDIAFMTVSNNVLCIALKSSKLIRIDLDRPEIIDEMELPKKSGEIVTIYGIFLDPTGSHLLISTHSGDNYILNFKSTKPKLLSRLKGLLIHSVAWCPFEPSRSTGPILVGTNDGSIYETQIESSNEYFKRDDRYVKLVWKEPSNQSISSLFAYQEKDSSIRKLIVTSKGTIWYWQHVMTSSTDAGPVYKPMFDKSEPIVEHFPEPSTTSFSVSPVSDTNGVPDIFAWVNGAGILFGSLNPTDISTIFTDARVLLNDEIMTSTSLSKTINSVILSQYHIFVQYGSSIVIINRLNGKSVFNDYIELESGEKVISLISDKRYSTYWLYSSHNIYEIRMNSDEQGEIWKTFLENKEYEKALKSAKSAYSKDVVNVVYGDHLLEQGDYMKAAKLLGPSSKPFEGIAAEFLEKNQLDSLKKFIELRLTRVQGDHNMKKIILTSTMIEIFMDKLNEADNKIAASGYSSLNAEDEKDKINKEFQAFIVKYKTSLDKDTIYEIISSHGRQEELLYYANEMDDTETVIRYWVSAEKWSQALKLIRQGDVRLAYKYSTVLLLNLPKETVDSWMRLTDVDPTRLLPALLNYSSQFRNIVKPEQNQAIRYLKYVITDLKVSDPVIYNTLISIYSSTPTISETTLLEFLQKHSPGHYDSDFALRMCTEFNRIQCSVHILCSIGLYEDALNLALSHDNVELAKLVADKPIDDVELRKSLWLSIAQNVIKLNHKNEDMFKESLKLLSECDLLRIEDLLSFFPEFTTIGDFKDELISSIEGYFDRIKHLDKEMEDSIDTGKNIQKEIQSFRKGYVLIEPGEACNLCSFPLATRKFYAFPCQHTFHADCLEQAILKSGDETSKRKIRQIRQSSNQKDVADLLAPILSARCILCNEIRVEEIDQPLITQMEKMNGWSI